MKRFTLWNSYVAITESKEFVDWNKTKIIGSFKCPAFSYRSSTQIKADPFLFEYNNAIYLFYEEKYKNGKGYIVCTWTSDLKNWSQPVVVLKAQFHLSFPYVFKINDKIYMLPESNESNELRLYECVDFPYKWKLNKIIFDNGKYVDSSIICKGDIYYLFTTHKTENSFYHELYYCNDLLSDKWIKHPQSPISNNPKFARNGGSVFSHNNNLFRPAQDCSVSYGNNLSIFNVTHLSIDKYEETLVATNFFPKYKFKHGGHHFSHIEYKGQNIIAFDKKSREYAITPLFSSLYALICRLMKITSHK